MTAPRLTITFDNGPTPGVTERVLDVLDEHAVRTTFFVVGNDLVKPGRREIVADAKRRGHAIGNHTLTHSVQFGTSADPDLPTREIDQAQELLGDLAHPDRYVRPWGDGRLSANLLSGAAVRHLQDGGYTLALWNCVPRDWEDPTGWPDRARAQIAQQDWTLLVVHDTGTGAMDALPGFLTAVRADGVEIRQELPEQCTPILRGELIGSLSGLVTEHPDPRLPNATE
jgi:peptidoglycan/xylan/chitin deacetylase (PgdA/CDA1 family)